MFCLGSIDFTGRITLLVWKTLVRVMLTAVKEKETSYTGPLRPSAFRGPQRYML